jgi:hypothetical protein
VEPGGIKNVVFARHATIKENVDQWSSSIPLRVNVFVYQLVAKMVNNLASVLVHVSQKILAAQNIMLLWNKQSFLELKNCSTRYLQNNKTVSSYLISHQPV